MLKEKKDTISLVFLIVVNLLPLVGVFFFDWDALSIILLYWSENLILGGYTILKLILVRVGTLGEQLSKLFVVPFFCFHYGAFCGAHGFFILMFATVFEAADELVPFVRTGEDPGMFEPLQLLVNSVLYIWRHRPPGMILPFLGLVVSHGVSFVQNYLVYGEYSRTSLKDQMGAPYGRIVLMHIAIIAAGVPVMLLGSPIPLLVILIGLKLAMDIRFHNREHEKMKEPGRYPEEGEDDRSRSPG
jgi:hypothetical protein